MMTEWLLLEEIILSGQMDDADLHARLRADPEFAEWYQQRGAAALLAKSEQNSLMTVAELQNAILHWVEFHEARMGRERANPSGSTGPEIFIYQRDLTELRRLAGILTEMR